MPWTEVVVDLIGPWTIVVGNEEYEFNALTSIDTTLNLVEMIRIDEKSSQHVRNKFEQSWLSRYPWPERCIHDNGGEFVGFEFQQLLSVCAMTLVFKLLPWAAKGTAFTRSRSALNPAVSALAKLFARILCASRIRTAPLAAV